jgi:hypothetical protein
MNIWLEKFDLTNPMKKDDSIYVEIAKRLNTIKSDLAFDNKSQELLLNINRMLCDEVDRLNCKSTPEKIILNTPLEHYSKILSVRVYNILRSVQVNIIKDIVCFTKKDFLRVNQCGRKITSEIEKFLNDLGLTFGMFEIDRPIFKSGLIRVKHKTNEGEEQITYQIYRYLDTFKSDCEYYRCPITIAENGLFNGKDTTCSWGNYEAMVELYLVNPKNTFEKRILSTPLDDGDSITYNTTNIS